MPARLDPWHNIVNVNWPKDEPTDEPFYPTPPVNQYCRFISGEEISPIYDGTTVRGYSTAYVNNFVGSLVIDTPEFRSNTVYPDVFLMTATESVTSRKNLGGLSPASGISFTFGRKSREGELYGHDVVSLIKDKVIVINNRAVMPPMYTDEWPPRPYPVFGTTGFPPNQRPFGTYGPLGANYQLGGAIGTYFGAGGENDPPGGHFALGLSPGSVYNLWIADPIQGENT